MKVPDSLVAKQDSASQLPVQEEFRLLRSILAGHRDHFRYFVDQYQRMVLNLIWRQTRNTAICQDLAQEVFIKAFSGLPGFRFEASFQTWITRITLNRISSYLASSPARDAHISTEEPPIDSPVLKLVVNPEEHAIGAQRMRRFYRAFLELPDHYREAVLMVTIDGRDYEEAARILGVPVGTIRSRIHQGRKLLKLAMEEP